MGLCDNNLRSVLDRLRPIQARAIAGLLVPAPYYIRPSQGGLVNYFNTLADAASAPIMSLNQ